MVKDNINDFIKLVVVSQKVKDICLQQHLPLNIIEIHVTVSSNIEILQLCLARLSTQDKLIDLVNVRVVYIALDRSIDFLPFQDTQSRQVVYCKAEEVDNNIITEHTF